MTTTSDLYLATTAHVMRGEGDQRKQVSIEPGQLVSDTDLSDDEVETLRDHGAIRPATDDDITNAEAVKTRKANEAAAKKTARDADELRARQSHDAAKLKKEEGERAVEKSNELASAQAAEAQKPATIVEPGKGGVDRSLRESEAAAEKASGAGDKPAAERIAEQDKARKSGSAPAPKGKGR